MAEADHQRTAQLIHDRVISGGYAEKITGWVTAEDLRRMPELHIELAEDETGLAGYLSWQVTYSTWRGLKGIYINDQFAINNSKDTLRGLLYRSISRGLCLGAQYVRTEADITEEELIETYVENGFWHVLRRAQYYLEAKNFTKLVEDQKLVPQNS